MGNSGVGADRVLVPVQRTPRLPNSLAQKPANQNRMHQRGIKPTSRRRSGPPLDHLTNSWWMGVPSFAVRTPKGSSEFWMRVTTGEIEASTRCRSRLLTCVTRAASSRLPRGLDSLGQETVEDLCAPLRPWRTPGRLLFRTSSSSGADDPHGGQVRGQVRAVRASHSGACFGRHEP